VTAWLRLETRDAPGRSGHVCLGRSWRPSGDTEPAGQSGRPIGSATRCRGISCRCEGRRACAARCPANCLVRSRLHTPRPSSFSSGALFRGIRSPPWNVSCRRTPGSIGQASRGWGSGAWIRSSTRAVIVLLMARPNQGLDRAQSGPCGPRALILRCHQQDDDGTRGRPDPGTRSSSLYWPWPIDPGRSVDMRRSMEGERYPSKRAARAERARPGRVESRSDEAIRRHLAAQALRPHIGRRSPAPTSHCRSASPTCPAGSVSL